MRELVAWITKELHKDKLSGEVKGVGDLSVMDALDVYRNDYTARLTGALGDTYSSIWFYLGDENFFALSHEYINSYLSTSFDLDDYGEYLPEFLEGSSWNKKYPYLLELAKIERSFHEMFHDEIKDVTPIDPSTLDPERPLVLSSRIALFKSTFPIHTLYETARSENKSAQIDFSINESMILFKNGEHVISAKLTDLQYNLLKEMQSGKGIDECFADLPLDCTHELTELFALLNGNGLLG